MFKNIAQCNSIDLDNYQTKNVIVRNKTFGMYFMVSFFSVLFVVSLFSCFIKDINYRIYLIIIMFLFFIIDISLILDFVFFKIEFKDNYIIFNQHFKKKKIGISDIVYFKVRLNNDNSIYYIEIYTRKIVYKYNISSLNKENFILLINLLKLGVEQKIDNQNIKKYKSFNSSIEFDDKFICLRNGKNVNIIKINEIKKIIFGVPKYNGSIGSGIDYTYKFKVLDVNLEKYNLSIILDREEEKEIINFFKEYKINYQLELLDNRPSAD